MRKTKGDPPSARRAERGEEKAGKELIKERKAMSHTEPLSSQREEIHEVEYLEAFMRLCLRWEGHHFEDWRET
jgi:hypothetical protein